MAGITFDLYGSNGNVLAKDLVTDEAGQINLPFNLPIGDYYFEETKTLPKYELNTDKIDFKVEQTDLTQTVSALASQNKQQPVTVQVANYQINSLVIKKVDAADSNQVLAGAVFRLTNDNGYSKEFTTDVNGLVTFDNLKLGRYWLTEDSKRRLGTRLIRTTQSRSQLILRAVIQSAWRNRRPAPCSAKYRRREQMVSRCAR